jgi:hypothetical protein
VNNQSATVGTNVAAPPAVLVRDAGNNPVVGVTVTFTVTAGVGQIDDGGGPVTGPLTVNTNGSGIAALTAWKLGTTAGTNTLTGAVSGLSGSPVTFTATGTAGAATTIALQAGSGQTTTVGTSVTTAPSVLVTDATSNPVAGVSVTFAVATGSGSISSPSGSTVVTNASGIAALSSWQLGATAGTSNNSVTATSGSLTGSPVTFTASATAGAATQIAANAGNNQTAAVSAAVPTPPSVLVRDAFNNPVSGVAVTFTVTGGGGTTVPASGSTVSTGNGIAALTSWTLGAVAGTNTVTAAVTGLAGSPVTFTATGTSTATHYVVTSSSLTPVAGTSVTVTAQLTDASANAVPTSGKTVAWSSTNGGTFATPTSLTDATGLATIAFTVSADASQTHAVTATDNTALTGTSASITILPPTPVAAAATSITETGFTANWSTSTGATYRLDVATDAGFSSLVSGYSNLNVGSASSQAVTGLSGGTSYFYRVRAVGTGGTTSNSNTVSVLTVPAAPVATAATSVTTSSFTANWNSSTGAASYRLDVAIDVGFATFVSGFQDVTVAGTSQSVTGLDSGVTYFYRVRAVDASGTSANSNTITVSTTPPAPVATAATNLTETSFSANWGATTGATSYRLDVSTDNFSTFVTGFNSQNVGNVTTFSVTGLVGGTTYQYRVRAVNSGGTSANSNTVSALTVPAAPVATAATSITTSSFTANWSSSTGATSYRLDVAIDAGFSSFVSGYQDLTVAGTSQSVTGLDSGITYFYRVRAVDASGTSANSNTITVSTTPPAPVATAATNLAETSFSANWSASTGATSYRLDVSTDNFSTFVTSFNDRNVGNVTTFSVTGLTGGTTYQYRVRAVNSGGTSANSNTISALTVPAAPVATAATSVTTSSFTANWNSSTGAADYRLDVATDAGFASFVSGYQDLTVAGTSQSVTGLDSGVTYFYRVRAVNASGTSANSNTVTVSTVPPAPVAATATDTTASSFTAHWGASTGATSYQLDVAIDAGFTTFVTGFQNLDVGNVTSFSVTGLTTATPYFYRLRAVNSGGTSANSNTITVTTL